MKSLYNWVSWVLPTRVRRHFTDWHKVRACNLGLLLLLLVTPALMFGQTKTVAISPILTSSTLLGPVDQAQQINVVLALPLSDPEGAANFARRVSTPGDPLFRQYINTEQFAARYGGNAVDYAALKEWATSSGFAIVHESPARTSLTIRASAAQIKKLFNTELNYYRSPNGDTFYSAATSPTVPTEIAARVSGVIGLTNSVQHAELAVPCKVLGENISMPKPGTEVEGGTGPDGTYSASDLRTIYQIPAYGDLAPQTVAIFAAGGFTPSDINVYLKTMKLPHPTVSFVGVDNYDGSVNNPLIEREAVLDIDTVIGINPKVQTVLVYEDGNDPVGVALIDTYDQIANDAKAQTVSISYGYDEVLQGEAVLNMENTALIRLASQGITVVAGAGDSGAYGLTGRSFSPAHLEVADPGSQPFVTCVGGTTLSSGRDEIYTGELVWNRLASTGAATGGGASSYWPIPSWQVPSYVTGNGGSATQRNTPDVAAVGDPFTGVAIYSKANGGWIQIGGTSLSAPIWAGFISILNAGLEYLTGQQIGFFNPTLYSVAFGNPSAALNPVVDGTNGDAPLYGTAGYFAGFGYNNCAGSGTIYGGVTAAGVLTVAQGGTPPSTFVFFNPEVTDTAAKIKWTTADLAAGYVLELHAPGLVNDVTTGFITKNTKFTFDHLAPKTGYRLYVHAVNAEGATSEALDFATK
jgi:subtilase family serine protease